MVSNPEFCLSTLFIFCLGYPECPIAAFVVEVIVCGDLSRCVFDVE